MLNRKEKVKSYYAKYNEPRKWLSKKASTNKKIHYGLTYVQIMLVLLVTVIGIVDIEDKSSDSVVIITTITALLAALKAIEMLLSPEKHWYNYRQASEAMKINEELYVENIAPYDTDEDTSYKTFIKQTIKIRARETQKFFTNKKG